MKALMKVSALVLAASWAGAALAGDTAPDNKPSLMESLAVLLDLTDAQKPQVQSIIQGEHAQMKALFEQAKAAGGKPDFQALHAARREISEDTLAKLAGVLSPVQLKKFQTLQQMHAHGFGHPHGAGGAPPPPAN
jgi:hypothetical protein